MTHGAAKVPQASALASAPDIETRVKLLPAAVAGTVEAICNSKGCLQFVTKDVQLAPVQGEWWAKLLHRLKGLLGFALPPAPEPDPDGDILVFAPTIKSVKAIRDAVRAASAQKGLGLNVLVCHGQMDAAELAAVKQSEPRRVIVATNYAETSVTFVNLGFVLDSGLINTPIWDTRTCSTRYDTQWHSQAGCKQRKGRVGRVRPGECFRLYTEVEYSRLPEQTPPEVAQMPLDSFFLSAKAAGIEDLNSFRWLGRSAGPAQGSSEAEASRSQAALRRRNAIDSSGDVTSRGLELGGLQVGRVELAECLAEADTFACSLEVATFLAFISQSRYPFADGEGGLLAYVRWRAGCYDDLEFYLRLYHHWTSKGLTTTAVYGHPDGDMKLTERRHEWCKSEGLNPSYFERVAVTRRSHLDTLTKGTHTDIEQRELDLERLHRVRLVLAKCLAEWAYVKSVGGGLRYRPYGADCPCPDEVEVDRDSACCGDPDVAAFVCVERQQPRAGRLFARHVVRIDPAWLPLLATAGPIGRALLLSRTLLEEARVAAACGRNVSARPVLDASGYRVRQELSRLRVLRSQWADDDSDAGVVLTVDPTTGVPVLVRKGTSDVVTAGDELRAYVTQVSGGRIDANQEQLIEVYRRMAGTDARTVDAIVTAIERDMESGEVRRIWYRIEPGIGGVLYTDNLCHSDRQRAAGLTEGIRRKDLCIRQVEKQKSRGGARDLWVVVLIPREVLLARKQRIERGQTFTGTVIGFDHPEKSERPVAAFVEILPGVSGYLHWRQAGGQLRRFQRGTGVKVRVTDVTPHQKQPERLRITLELA